MVFSLSQGFPLAFLRAGKLEKVLSLHEGKSSVNKTTGVFVLGKSTITALTTGQDIFVHSSNVSVIQDTTILREIMTMMDNGEPMFNVSDVLCKYIDVLDNSESTTMTREQLQALRRINKLTDKSLALDSMLQATKEPTDAYSQGLYNGIELATAIAQDREPKYDNSVIDINQRGGVIE